MAIYKQTVQLGAGSLEIETGKFAKLADGAVTVRIGDTIVIVTAVSATKVKDGQDFFPLSCRIQRKSLRSRPLPWRLLQARRPPDRKGNPHLPHDGPPIASVVPEGLLLRHPGRRDSAQR